MANGFQLSPSGAISFFGSPLSVTPLVRDFGTQLSKALAVEGAGTRGLVEGIGGAAATAAGAAPQLIQAGRLRDQSLVEQGIDPTGLDRMQKRELAGGLLQFTPERIKSSAEAQATFGAPDLQSLTEALAASVGPERIRLGPPETVGGASPRNRDLSLLTQNNALLRAAVGLP